MTPGRSMRTCPSCTSQVPSENHFCGTCGLPFGDAPPDATQTIHRRPFPVSTPRSTITQSLDDERFPPGTLLAKRYRIISMLGRGGMGEVFRANDLLLGQPVALKFLPPWLVTDEHALSRFRNEVRIARQISHPNVCRVYDIGEAEDSTYLSMEYVDGEDLASLLRRIGRLPTDKALDLARQLCAGLAAAHDKGVVHRDLKPGNVMLDGVGRLRIMDFGLAAVVGEIKDFHSGTPAYMAPEQRLGLDVTERSDIYSLGAVLHEIFTGKRPSNDSSHPDLAPEIDTVIRRCLAEDPQKRPPSALAVSAALPGGDLLAAALAAGETPSPETVAKAGAHEGMQVATAAACLAIAFAGLIGIGLLNDKGTVLGKVAAELPPEVLAAKARDIVKSFGYGEKPRFTASGWTYDDDYIEFARKQPDSKARWTGLKGNQPPALRFWYRESPVAMLPSIDANTFKNTRFDPPLQPGMLEMVLDPEGRLVEFQARPALGAPYAQSPSASDWSALFAAAQLPMNAFQPAAPRSTLPLATDSRVAWTGTYTGSKDPLHLEAASYSGRPVYFRVEGPWTDLNPSTPAPGSAGGTILLILLPLVAGLFAKRNLRLGRGDTKGAQRLGVVVFACAACGAWLQANHTWDASAIFGVLYALAKGLFVGVALGLAYLAFEPLVRRRSPDLLISWSRLLSGQWKDPLVGANILSGIALGTTFAALIGSIALKLWATGNTPQNAWDAVASWPRAVTNGVFGGIFIVFALTLFRFLFKKDLLAWSVLALVIGVVLVPFQALYREGLVPFLLGFLTLTIIVGLALFALQKFGVLTIVAMLTTVYVSGALASPTLQPAAWYSTASWFMMIAVAGVAIAAFYINLGSRKILSAE